MLSRLRRGVAARLGRRLPVAGAAGAAEQEFLEVARRSFVCLQAAWDAADLHTLAALTTDQLLAELRDELTQRGPGPNRTEVLTIEARLLALEDLHEAYIASIEFTGMIREQLDAAAEPFRELWLLANLKAAGRGWRLVRVQSLS